MLLSEDSERNENNENNEVRYFHQNEAIQKIYSASGLASGEIDYMNITIYAGEDGRISFTIDSSNNYHYMVYSGHYSGESIKPYQEEFDRILQNDPFYTETVRKASDTAWTHYYD